jgi:hypothetical protein
LHTSPTHSTEGHDATHPGALTGSFGVDERP